MSIFQGVSPYLSVSECDDICPPLRDTVDLFISGRHGAYIEQVEKYNQNPDVLETADTLKSCVDERLTAEDKQDALSALVGQAVCECACGAYGGGWGGVGGEGCVRGLLRALVSGGDHFLSTLALPWQTESKKILMNEEVERWPTPTVWERILQEDSIQSGALELALTAQLCLVTGLGPSRPS